MKVAELLSAAGVLLDEPVAETATVWPLGAAVLTRQAIEATVDVYWDRTVKAMRYTLRKEQWLALPAYLGRAPELPAAEYAWSALSEACHHRDYDVGLTEAELRDHLGAARAFAQVVAAKLAGSRPAAPAEREHRAS